MNLKRTMNKKTIPILYLISIIFIMPFLNAIEDSRLDGITDSRISIDIEDKNTYVDYSFKLEPETNQFNLEVPKGSRIIYLRDDFGDIEYELENDTIRMNFIANIDESDDINDINYNKDNEENKNNEERLVLLKLKTNNLVAKKEGFYEIVFEAKIDAKITINLPDKVIINSIETNPKTEIKTYDEFSYAEFDAENGDILIARYRTHMDFYSSYLIYVILIFIILIAFYFLINKKRKSKVKQNVEMENKKASYDSSIIDSNNVTTSDKINKEQILKSLNILNEKEKKIIEYVLNNEGCLQSDLQKETGYSKSNLTKIIHKLEFRALLKKKNIGKINRLYLGEKVKTS